MADDRRVVEARVARLLEEGRQADAATAALEGYGAEILGYLVSILRDESAAGDVFADFCEKLWRGLDGFRADSTFRTWAYRIAWSAAQTHWRDPFRRRVRRLTTSEYSQVADRLRASASSIRPDPQAAGERLAALRATLKPDEQTLLILRVDRGLSWKEIAQVVAEDGAPPPDPAALRKRFERLKERLVRLAEKEGLLAR